MPNEFLPKLKEFKIKYKDLNKLENELTDDDIIAMLDKHLQRQITEEREPDGDEEKDDDRSNDDQTPANDEIEKFSSSLKNKMEELSSYVTDKKKEIDTLVKQIKRKDPPSGEISDKALTNKEKLKANWFEVDI